MFRRPTSWKAFWVAFPLLSLIPIVALSGYAMWSAADRITAIQRTEEFAVELQRMAVYRSLDRAAQDVCLLAGQNELRRYLIAGDRGALNEIASEYRTLALSAPVYDQIRLLNRTGREQVRVEARDGSAVIVPEDRLRDSAGQYYVEDTFALAPGEVYLSPLALSSEAGAVKIPYTPMIRLGTAIADSAGQTVGMVMVNYRARSMLDAVVEAGAGTPGQPMMINEDGYWLVSPDPPPAWGFMFPDKADARLQVVYPEAWAAMDTTAKGSVRTEAGLFTFDTFHPRDTILPCPSFRPDLQPLSVDRGYGWIIASYVPADQLADIETQAVLEAMLIGGPMVLLLAIGTRAVAVVVSERRNHRAHLEALARFDALTKLANKTTFEERIEEEITRSERHGRTFALLYLDLDGFKAINDSMGHAAGDMVLMEVARALKDSCRAVDLAARVGGDEFGVLLSEVGDATAACHVAEKMLERIHGLSWNGRSVGASIGVALWPKHATDAGTLVRRADEAMYAAKKAGKNTVRMTQNGHPPAVPCETASRGA
ncbi:sensor domain-containing diguanylate cyclase [uncultured Rhodospira sp.]|uniref:sensor domain-containing diguanylate cyclase n=1 Tax=uncultured Rhodospira sp. TaxID=1936189 RepID=UPI0026254E78|nr:sensor domain-containing diguanylate cyclase [uncultured Rhodospira sp.]